MKRSNELDTILDICLERVFAGETVEACVQDYPQYADELRDLLETVTGVREAVDITPSTEFRQRAYREFQDAVRDLKPARSGGFFGAFALHRWAVTAVSVIAVIVLAGGGTVYAASGSLPDSPLYNVKLATESVRIAFAFSDETKTELYAEFANRRVEEIVVMAGQGEVDGVNRATDILDRQLIAMADVNNGDAMLQSMATSGGAVNNNDDMLSASSNEMAVVPRESETITLAPAPEAVEERKFLASEIPPDTTENDLGEVDGIYEERAATDHWYSSSAEAPGDDEDNLRDSVMDDAFSNTVKLEEAKENAPESLREAIERAIEIALRGYGIAISNIR